MNAKNPSDMQTYHELDHLAGSWTDKDVEEFEKNTKQFENIDKELWSCNPFSMRDVPKNL